MHFMWTTEILEAESLLQDRQYIKTSNKRRYLVQIKANSAVQNRVEQHHQEADKKTYSRRCLHENWPEQKKFKKKEHKEKQPWHVDTKISAYQPYVAPTKSNMCTLVISKVDWPKSKRSRWKQRSNNFQYPTSPTVSFTLMYSRV